MDSIRVIQVAKPILSITIVALFLLEPVEACAQDEVVADEPTYVTFTFHWIEEDMPADANLPALVDEVKEAFGAQPPDAQRFVGFSPGLINALNLSPKSLEARIVQVLDVAEESGMPVFFHLDDMHFWYKRPELFNDPEAVEWSAFPSEDERHGPVIQRYWLNWGNWLVFPAGPPCFESPKFRTDVARTLKESVARPIVERLNCWKAEGREYLFAGIAIGNETQVAPDLRMLAKTPEGEEPGGLLVASDPPVSVRMRRDEMVRGGFAALHWRGHTEDSVARLASETGESVDQVVSGLLFEVAHDYAEFRAKALHDAGLPRTRIYTHFTSPVRRSLELMARVRPDFTAENMRPLEMIPPVASAVNAYSRPGFTVVFNVFDVQDLVEKIAEARGEDEVDSAWAGVETYPATGQPGRKLSQEQCEAYLGAVFAHGACVWNIYVWKMGGPTGDSPFIANTNPGVIQAVKNWVEGKELPTDWVGFRPEARIGAPLPATLQTKQGQLMEEFRRWQREGRDPTPVAQLMGEFDPFMAMGQYKEAEALLDEALTALRSNQSFSPMGPSPSLMAKGQRIQELTPAWIQAGNDPKRIHQLGEKLGPLLESGEYEAAEKIMDRILAVLDEASGQPEAAEPLRDIEPSVD